MFYVKLADCICRIEQGTYGGLFASWVWKLDQYRIQEPMESEIDFELRMNDVKAVKTDSSDYDAACSVFHQVFGLYELDAFHQSEGGYLWIFKRCKERDTLLEYTLSADWKSITIRKDASHTAGSLGFEYLRYIIQGCLLIKRALTFHGVLLEKDGVGFILSADSGVGKTTRARVLRDSENALILNGDRSVVRREKNNWVGYSLPWCGSSGEYSNRSVPIRAIVLVERAASTDIIQLQGMDAYREVLPFVQAPFWEPLLAGTALDLTERFTEEVPVWKIRSQPTPEAMKALLLRI